MKEENMILESEQKREEVQSDTRMSRFDEDAQNDNPGLANGFKESKLKRGLDIFGCLFVLNIIFVISCIPIITIGAAFTALYAMMFRIQKHDDYTVAKEYFYEMKANFKKGTQAWLMIIVAFVVMYGEYAYICNFEGGMATFYSIALVVELVLVSLVLPFVFPLLAYFDNTVLNTFKNSLLLAISNIGAWLKMFAAWVVPVVFGIGNEAVFINIWYLWLMLIIGLIAYGTSLTAVRVFRNVANIQKEAEENKDEREAAKIEKQKKREAKKEPVKKKSIQERLDAVDKYNNSAK